MRDYSKVSPLFWSGRTGKQLRGNPDAQRVAFYLISCPSANMLGLYYLPLPTLMHEIGITEEGASKALRRVQEVDFGYYDPPSEYVFVPRMALFQIGPILNPKDNRHTGLVRELENHRKSPFFNQFLGLYRERYQLESVPPEPSPFEAPPKPLRSQEQEQEKEQEQEQEKKPSSAKADRLTPRYTAEFEAFWIESTKRGSKVEAFKEWQRLNPTPELMNTIRAALRDWKASEQWQDESKQPHLCRWLRRRGWEEIVPKLFLGGPNGKNSADRRATAFTGAPGYKPRQ